MAAVGHAPTWFCAFIWAPFSMRIFASEVWPFSHTGCKGELLTWGSDRWWITPVLNGDYSSFSSTQWKCTLTLMSSEFHVMSPVNLTHTLYWSSLINFFFVSCSSHNSYLIVKLCETGQSGKIFLLLHLNPPQCHCSVPTLLAMLGSHPASSRASTHSSWAPSAAR